MPALPDFDAPEAEVAGKENSIEAARIAIEAMREPTDEMMEAFARASKNEWRAAIDEALK